MFEKTTKISFTYFQLKQTNDDDVVDIVPPLSNGIITLVKTKQNYNNDILIIRYDTN